MTLTEDDIYLILSSTKYPLGTPEWVSVAKNSSQVELKTDLIVDNEDIDCRLELILKTDLRSPAQRGEIVLLCDKSPLERLSYCPDHRHSNPPSKKIPKEHRGKTFKADESRHYPWDLNKFLGWPPPDGQIRICKEIDENISSYLDAVNYFFNKTGIELYVPELEYEPRLPLE